MTYTLRITKEDLHLLTMFGQHYGMTPEEFLARLATNELRRRFEAEIDRLARGSGTEKPKGIVS